MKHNAASTKKIEQSIAAYSTFGTRKPAPLIFVEQAATEAGQQHQKSEYLLNNWHGAQIQSTLGDENFPNQAKSGNGEKRWRRICKENCSKS